MNFLIIEDNSQYIDVLTRIIKKLSSDAVITVRSSADEAIELLRENFFDIVILDMSVPASVDDSVHKPAHGMRVFAETQKSSPGSPIFVLTGSSARSYGPHVEDLVRGCAKADIWGDGVERNVMNFSRKRDLRRFEEELTNYIQSFNKIRDVELDRGSLDLRPSFDRLLRIFSHSIGGASCTIIPVSGGLSGTPVFRLQIRDGQGNLAQGVIGKLGPIATIVDESQRYDRFANLLPPEATPRKMRVQRWGAGADGGVFYQLAQGYNQNIFSRLMDVATIEAAVGGLARMTSTWARKQVQKKVSDIRRIELSDEKFEEVVAEFELDWLRGFEQHAVRTSWACTHGDMHGANILVDEDSNPILIDFGDMSDGPASRDPLTLEFSAFFHVDGPLRRKKWPGAAATLAFTDVNAYLENCPAASFVRACRAWAENRTASQREKLAVAYAYFVRQLKYEDTDKDLIKNLLQGVKIAFDRT
ncbi:response regulator [Burkholderia gladioli]|uniref:phosphotransferase n=1 Tax=Burkholderia gladioli TaxID=28095 RepID=UPI00265610B6|nr:phosphotransferase [Burkholderia gladioli]MDN7603915.1 response regulator [Burkholderia gladioli]